MPFPFLPMTCMQGKPRIFFASALQVQEFIRRNTGTSIKSRNAFAVRASAVYNYGLVKTVMAVF